MYLSLVLYLPRRRIIELLITHDYPTSISPAAKYYLISLYAFFPLRRGNCGLRGRIFVILPVLIKNYAQVECKAATAAVVAAAAASDSCAGRQTAIAVGQIASID